MHRHEYWGVLHDQAASLRITSDAVRAAVAATAITPSWQPGLPLAVVAMGASTFAADVLVARARERGRAVLNWPASEWLDCEWPAVGPTIAISESGRSPETIAALRRAPGLAVATTNVDGSPITTAADLVVGWGGVPDAGVYLSGYTSSLVSLGYLGEWLGLAGLAAGLDALDSALGPWIPAVVDATAALLAERFGASLPAVVDCVGGGASWAAAQETALMVREAGRTPSGAYPVDQYLHGPAESMGPDTLLVVFGGGRADELVVTAESVGVPVLQIATSPVGRHGLALPDVGGPIGMAVCEAIVGQALAGHLGDRRGHELGTFLHTFAGTKLPEDHQA